MSLPVTSDADGNFVLQGVPDGVHRLRVELAGRRTTLTYDFAVRKNVADALVPLFTDAEIDSVLNANGAPPWDRAQVPARGLRAQEHGRAAGRRDRVVHARRRAGRSSRPARARTRSWW